MEESSSWYPCLRKALKGCADYRWCLPPVVFECCKDLKSWQKAAQNFFSDIWILMRKELFVTLLRVPYVQSGHVRGVFWGKIKF